MPPSCLTAPHPSSKPVPRLPPAPFRAQGPAAFAASRRRRAVNAVNGQAADDGAEGAALLVLADEDKEYYKEVNDAGSLEGVDTACPGDFYELLGIEVNADKDAVRAAYRSLQRLVHPDVAGQQGTGLSILLNRAYKLLTDDALRAAYDKQLAAFRREVGSYDGKPVSSWLGPAGEQRALFVDETTCIGCRNCCGIAPNTFFLEDEWGRARVSHQWGDEEEALREAMDMCPVNCIYFVKRKQLALLEYVMKTCKREDIAILARRRSGNMGAAPACHSPFNRAEVFLRQREGAKSGEELDDATREGQLVQDQELSASITKAWLELKPELRAKGWPSWHESVTMVGT